MTRRALDRHLLKLHIAAAKWAQAPVNAWGKWSNPPILPKKAGSQQNTPPDTGLEPHSIRFALELPYWNRFPNLALYLLRQRFDKPSFVQKEALMLENVAFFFFLLSLELWLEIIGSVTGSNQKWQSLGYKAFASSLTIPPRLPQNKT